METGSAGISCAARDEACLRVDAEMIKRRRQTRISKTARETSEIVALLRQLREKMGVVEELEPDNTMLREFQHMRGWAIIELRRIRAGVELNLRRRDISARERKAAAGHLHLISLVESEIDVDSGGDTAH
jgi:hypothetical protein